MTSEFADKMKDEVRKWKTGKRDPVEALRDLELICAKANEDFGTPVPKNEDPRRISQGQQLVETVYGGRFVANAGGNGMTFTDDVV